MKTSRFLRILPILLFGTALFLATPANAQKSKKSTRTTVKEPTAPTPIDVKERTIKDLLCFPFSCITAKMDTREEAQEQIKAVFGTCESVNLMPGLHCNGTFDFTYRGTPIGVCYYDWQDNRQWYRFYFDTQKEAMRFYNLLSQDIRNAGIPLSIDKMYGGMSNRTRPVTGFKWVYVNTPEKIKKADESNIDGQDVVGMYVVELGVYRR